jgi:hypothetical protein
MNKTRKREELGPRRLPTVHLDGEEYFVDVRLGEFRTKTPPIRHIESIDFASARGQRLLKQCTILECQRCGQAKATVGPDSNSSDRCIRCGGHLFVTPVVSLHWSDNPIGSPFAR